MVMPQQGPRTLFDKIWDSHRVLEREDGQTLLSVDRHLIHDGSLRPFEILRERGLTVRRPDRTFGVPDHYIPTTAGRSVAAIADPEARAMVNSIEVTAIEQGIRTFPLGDVRQGIMHVVGPEQGLTQPGLLMACGDSHTSTHGALGAFAFGIGSSEVAHVMATQTIWQVRPKTMRINVGGRLGPGVAAKDLILAIIARIGAAGATGHIVEYAGPAIRALSIEQRLTVCNMSIEAGARAGLIAPDDRTYDYLYGRPFSPAGAAWEQALAFWRTLPSDEGAGFDREIDFDASSVAPMATWGTSPEHALPVNGRIPDPAGAADAAERANWTAALDYMGLKPGMAVTDIPIHRVFIGSCTNSRIEDLRAAAAVFAGRRAVVPAWVVPGSGLVKRQAEAEGLDRIFLAAGVEWREPGCSMCVGMNGDLVAEGAHCASTSNRNFPGRQGKGARTHLVSPAMAAAAAVTGRLADVRRLPPA
jgi:3-isopropylmalate/(R)-2-methylmalate dehydratase large subunit